jgi:predicted enzyme related to lactoylglutathione lyase
MLKLDIKPGKIYMPWEIVFCLIQICLIAIVWDTEGKNCGDKDLFVFCKSKNDTIVNNPVQWFEIATTDLERAKNFYAKVFDLEFQFVEMPDSKMYMFGAPDAIGSGGCLLHSAEVKPSADGTRVYFSCEDVDIQAGRVEEAGGKLLLPKTDIGEFGFFATIIDSEGNRIGLHSNK